MKTALRNGFTLIELLAVVVIIAILLGIMTGAAQFVVKVARDRRLSMTCRALESAMSRYRHEYGAWPIPRVPNTPAGDYDQAYLDTPTNRFYFVVDGANNKEWFHLLRATPNNALNAKQIRFVDDTTIFTVDSQGARIPLHIARRSEADLKTPFVGVNRAGQTVYFGIRINVDRDTVEVTK
jgi:prepilin-type N-terminal cleavage/methylation domain-containing protein